MKRFSVNQAVLVSTLALVFLSIVHANPAFADKKNLSGDVAQIPQDQEFVTHAPSAPDVANPTANVVYAAILTVFAANVIKTLKS